MRKDRLMAAVAGMAALGACASTGDPSPLAASSHNPAPVAPSVLPNAGPLAVPLVDIQPALSSPASKPLELETPSHGGGAPRWSEGEVYRVRTAPERLTDIALEPGEALLSVAAGDTARWVIADTASGAGPTRRAHVLVKPVAIGIRTNLLIATDRRVYYLDLESKASAAVTKVAWTYAKEAAAPDANEAAVDPKGLALEALDFGYRVEGDRPLWRPVRAFDDGRQVFIEFRETLARTEAPPLFLVGRKGEAELVNYRVRDRFYIVDRLFAAAELRLGKRPQQVVRIIRVDPSSEGRGS